MTPNVEKRVIAEFKTDMKNLHLALLRAKASASLLPTDKNRGYFAEQCLRYLERAEREMDEVDGKNGYFEFVENDSKIAENKDAAKTQAPKKVQ